jgi:hypothetical protein
LQFQNEKEGQDRLIRLDHDCRHHGAGTPRRGERLQRRTYSCAHGRGDAGGWRCDTDARADAGVYAGHRRQWRPEPAGLPDSLPPFDIPAALKRVTGKRKLLRKLLVDFHRKYSGAMAELRRMLDGDEWEEAQRLAPIP